MILFDRWADLTLFKGKDLCIKITNSDNDQNEKSSNQYFETSFCKKNISQICLLTWNSRDELQRSEDSKGSKGSQVNASPTTTTRNIFFLLLRYQVWYKAKNKIQILTWNKFFFRMKVFFAFLQFIWHTIWMKLFLIAIFNGILILYISRHKKKITQKGKSKTKKMWLYLESSFLQRYKTFEKFFEVNGIEMQSAS